MADDARGTSVDAGGVEAVVLDAPLDRSRRRVRRESSRTLHRRRSRLSGPLVPGKSAVGGGILVIAPGRASIAVWSPGLNAKGNSQLGTLAVQRLAHATGWSVFG